MVTVIAGDVLEVLPRLPAGSVDAIVTSPPYLDARPDYAAFALHDYGELFDELRRVCVGPMVVNVGRLWRDNREVLWWHDVIAAAELAGWPHVDTVVWAKLNGNPIQGAVVSNAHEYLLLFGEPSQFDTEAVRTEYAAGSVARLRRRWVSHIAVKGDTRDEMPSRQRRDGWVGRRLRENDAGARAASVVVVGTGRHKGNPHPAPMPLELAEYLVRLVGGSTILDPFAGSGTTGVAARMHGRDAVLIELDERYVDLIRRRLSLPLEVEHVDRRFERQLELEAEA